MDITYKELVNEIKEIHIVNMIMKDIKEYSKINESKYLDYLMRTKSNENIYFDTVKTDRFNVKDITVFVDIKRRNNDYYWILNGNLYFHILNKDYHFTYINLYISIRDYIKYIELFNRNFNMFVFITNEEGYRSNSVLFKSYNDFLNYMYKLVKTKTLDRKLKMIKHLF